MAKRTWQPKKSKPPPLPKVPDDVRTAIDENVKPVVAKLRKRYCKRLKSPLLNWPDDLIVRWHRDCFYFVAIMRTPHDHSPTFEVHVARMEHAGDGRFNLAVPMRRGWNTFLTNASPEECLKQVAETVCL